MIFGYCRVSTNQQKIERQVKNIGQNFPDAKIFKDYYTGKTTIRPEFEKMLRMVKQGDTIVFDEVSRMSRNAKEGFSLYKELYEKGINLVFLKEPHINTDSYKNAMQVSIPKVQIEDKVSQNLIDGIVNAISTFMLAKVESDIYKAFEQAEKEIQFLSERTKEGQREAIANGKQMGLPKGTKFATRKSQKAKKIIKQHSIYFGGTLQDKDVIKLAEISRNSFYKYKKEIIEEKMQKK